MHRPLSVLLAPLLIAPILLVQAPAPTYAEPRPQAPAAVAAPRSADPRLTQQFFLNKDSQPFRASRKNHRFDRIGQTPMAMWVSENWYPMKSVKKRVKKLAHKAARKHRTPVFAVYAIPARDCGGYSGGGLDAGRYRTWIGKIARGIRGTNAIVILEPDALGHLGDCAGQGHRTELLRDATRVLAAAGAWVYIDAAHTGWVKPSQMAKRLIRSGVRQARGFSVNVASFVRTDIERRYAKKIITALDKRGVGNVHYVMDTSRNGGGQKNGNNWCNPLDARLGREPHVVAGRHLDAYLWVKAPGESDGNCNGGPYAGAWWPDYALRLMGR